MQSHRTNKVSAFNASNAVNVSNASSGVSQRFSQSVPQSISRRSFIAAAGGAALWLAGAVMTHKPMHQSIAHATESGASVETEAALADAQARYDEATAQLNELNNEVFDAEARYESITADLDATNQRIADLQTQIDDEQTQLEQAQDILADRVNAEYKAGKTSLLEVVLQATSFSDLTNRLYYANKTADADAQAIQNVRDIKASLESDKAEQEDQRAQQEQLQAEQQAQIDTLNAQIADVEAYKASLDSEVQSLMAQRGAEIEAAAEAARQAAAEEAARQAAEDAQAQAAAQAAAQGAYVNATQDDAGNYVVTDTSSDSDSSSGYTESVSSGSSGYQPADVVSAAYNYLGTPYSVLDCSGLTSQAYADCGYYIIHQSGAQYNTVVSKGNLVSDAGSLVPGNLVFYARSGSIYHVAMYVGDGMIIESIPSSGVAVHSIYYCDGYCGGGSPL